MGVAQWYVHLRHHFTDIILSYTLALGVFRKLLPLARTHNARVILLNRRDFPGTEPYTEEELALLPPPPGEEQAGTFTEGPNVRAFMQARARELYDFLVDLVRRDGIPRAQRERNFGGIVVVGWSFGVTWMSALLSHVASFPVPPGEPSLREHILRVVFFGTRITPHNIRY